MIGGRLPSACLFAFYALLIASLPLDAAEGPRKGTRAAASANPVVVLETTMGTIKIELLPGKAPETAKNFLNYVNAGFYNGTIFHRVIPNFMIQAGGILPNLMQKTPNPPIKNESKNGLKNLRGTVAMGRRGDPHSATSHFFINVTDNPHLDAPAGGWGYAVFGRVISGMDVVDKIQKVKTTTKGQMQDVPVEPVIITRAYVEKTAVGKS